MSIAQALASSCAVARQLKANVWSPHLGRFLIVPVLLAILFAMSPTPPELNVAVITGAMLAWALSFPRLKGKERDLPPSAVDFWYYSLALLGVVLFFIVNSAERKTLTLRDTINSAIATKDNLGARRLLVQETQEREARVQAQIASRERDVLSQIKAIAKQRAEVNQTILNECGPFLFRKRLEDIARKDTNRDLRDGGSPTHVEVAKSLCQNVHLESYWPELAHVTSSQQLLEIVRKHSIGDRFTVAIDGKPLGVGAVARYLAVPLDSEAARKEIADIDSRIATEELQERQARAALAVKTDPGQLSLRDRFAKIAYFLWPYVLLTALAMKLARKPYSFKPC